MKFKPLNLTDFYKRVSVSKYEKKKEKNAL